MSTHRYNFKSFFPALVLLGLAAFEGSAEETRCLDVNGSVRCGPTAIVVPAKPDPASDKSDKADKDAAEKGVRVVRDGIKTRPVTPVPMDTTSASQARVQSRQ